MKRLGETQEFDAFYACPECFVAAKHGAQNFTVIGSPITRFLDRGNKLCYIAGSRKQRHLNQIIDIVGRTDFFWRV